MNMVVWLHILKMEYHLGEGRVILKWIESDDTFACVRMVTSGGLFKQSDVVLTMLIACILTKSFIHNTKECTFDT
jgi:hypothetical protein